MQHRNQATNTAWHSNLDLRLPHRPHLPCVEQKFVRGTMGQRSEAATAKKVRAQRWLSETWKRGVIVMLFSRC